VIPKSLHTVSVLVAIASQNIETGRADTIERAVDFALVTLGYRANCVTDPDPYQLRAAAVRKLEKATRS
jgi:hypothetical protein